MARVATMPYRMSPDKSVLSWLQDIAWFRNRDYNNRDYETWR
jgi:hypothetical protein